jgi:hypothetical protein
MYMSNNFFYTFPQVKNKPYQPEEEYMFIVENGAVGNSLFLTSAPPQEEWKRNTWTGTSAKLHARLLCGKRVNPARGQVP